MKLDPLASLAGSEEKVPTTALAAQAAAELSPLGEWQKAHDALLAQERRFSLLVPRYAEGQASRDELERARRELQAVRDLADAVLQKVLGLRLAAASS